MKREIAMLLLVAVLIASGGVAFAQEEECSEGNFAVANLPKNISSYPEPCSIITLPANSLARLEVVRQPLSVQFGENKVVVTKMTFRVGEQYEAYTLRPTEPYRWPLRPDYEMRITDLPKHLHGGESALWYEIGEGSSAGEKLVFLANYLTQVLVPRGSTVKILPDTKILVKYDGQERECAPDEIAEFEGKSGIDLIEIRGLDRDGRVMVGVTMRKLPSLAAPPARAIAPSKKQAKKK